MDPLTPLIDNPADPNALVAAIANLWHHENGRRELRNATQQYDGQSDENTVRLCELIVTGSQLARSVTLNDVDPTRIWRELLLDADIVTLADAWGRVPSVALGTVLADAWVLLWGLTETDAGYPVMLPTHLDVEARKANLQHIATTWMEHVNRYGFRAGTTPLELLNLAIVKLQALAATVAINGSDIAYLRELARQLRTYALDGDVKDGWPTWQALEHARASIVNWDRL